MQTPDEPPVDGGPPPSRLRALVAAVEAVVAFGPMLPGAFGRLPLLLYIAAAAIARSRAELPAPTRWRRRLRIGLAVVMFAPVLVLWIWPFVWAAHLAPGALAAGAVGAVAVTMVRRRSSLLTRVLPATTPVVALFVLASAIAFFGWLDFRDSTLCAGVEPGPDLQFVTRFCPHVEGERCAGLVDRGPEPVLMCRDPRRVLLLPGGEHVVVTCGSTFGSEPPEPVVHIVRLADGAPLASADGGVAAWVSMLGSDAIALTHTHMDRVVSLRIPDLEPLAEAELEHAVSGLETDAGLIVAAGGAAHGLWLMDPATLDVRRPPAGVTDDAPATKEVHDLVALPEHDLLVGSYPVGVGSLGTWELSTLRWRGGRLIGTGVRDLLLVPGRKHLLAAMPFVGRVAVLDLPDLTVRRWIRAGFGASSLEWTGDSVVVGSYFGGWLRKFDWPDGSPSGEVQLGRKIRDVALLPGTDDLLAVSRCGMFRVGPDAFAPPR
jgi:hypothetical protein